MVVRLVAVLLVLLPAAVWTCATPPAAVAAAPLEDNPKYHLDYGPDDGKDCPVDFSDECGIDRQGNYCDYRLIETDTICAVPEAGVMPGTVEICGDELAKNECSPASRKKIERKKLKKSREKSREAVRDGDLPLAEQKKWDAFLTHCVTEEKQSFHDCQEAAYRKFGPSGGKTISGRVDDMVSGMAEDAMAVAARHIGEAVVWLLEQFAAVFNDSSTIDLRATGISGVKSIATALSAVIAVFLLLTQFGKVGISHQGGPAATALAGLAKWAVISAVYWVVTQTALQWSDAVSDWIVDVSFGGGTGSGQNSAEAMQEKLGALFSGLVAGGGATAAAGALATGSGMGAASVAVVIVLGVVCILAIGALWVEILLRQAGIMILVATMPIVLAGQMSDATKQWWPKARDALVALIVLKPVIVLCFAIGFAAMGESTGVQNMIVGLVIFVAATVAWPVVAKFMTFTTVGAGVSAASGLLSGIGSSAASVSGSYRPELGGAGAVGGGPGYTRALEQDVTQTTAQPAGKGDGALSTAMSRLKGPGGRLAPRVAAPLGLGLQVMSVAKDVVESQMANTAAHAGLDHASPGGRHVVISPRGPMPGVLGIPPSGIEDGAAGPPPVPSPVPPPPPPPFSSSPSSPQGRP